MMGKEAESLVSQIDSKISDFESDVKSNEKKIAAINKNIDALNRKIKFIRDANEKLEKIIKSIIKTIKELNAFIASLKQIKEQLTKRKEEYDSCYKITINAITLAIDKTSKAYENGYQAISYLSKVSDRTSKSLKVSSPDVFSRLSMNLNSASINVSNTNGKVSNDKKLYIGRLKDNISTEVSKNIDQFNSIIDNESRVWSDMSLNFKNAYYQLTFYLECKIGV